MQCGGLLVQDVVPYGPRCGGFFVEMLKRWLNGLLSYYMVTGFSVLYTVQWMCWLIGEYVRVLMVVLLTAEKVVPASNPELSWPRGGKVPFKI